jgi:hypothetical protein
VRTKISLTQLDCGCFRYCDSCTDNQPSDSDLEFSRSIAESFGEAWFDWRHWNATEFSATRIHYAGHQRQDRQP